MAAKILRRARAEGTPLIDGDTATFVWQGERAPQLIGDWNDWEIADARPMARAGRDVWTYALELPADAYIEYAYAEGSDEARLPDPFNPRVTPNGLGKLNHYFYMPGGGPTPLARRWRDVAHGVVTRHAVPTGDLVVGRMRTVYLYRPPAPGPWPLVVVWDGREYLRRARLPEIVDNLVAEGRLRPVALAMVENGGQARTIEYSCNDMSLAFLMERVLPLARANLDLIDVGRSPGAYGVVGASMGGLMALYAGVRAPEVFGRVLSQSGAFSLEEHEFVVCELIRLGGVRPLKIWLDVGRYEGLLDANRRMRDLLAAKGYDVAYHEYNAGHNYPAWRDDVWRGLEYLYHT